MDFFIAIVQQIWNAICLTSVESFLEIASVKTKLNIYPITINLRQMKQFNHKMFIAAVVVGGLFIGAVKGQEARTRWVNKMRTRDERKMKTNPKEVMLDDYEIASFHNN